MIKESTEDKAAMFARILTDGLKTPEPAQVSEPAAAAASWNAPSMNMAAAMASLLVANATKEESTPTLSSDALRAAAEFAENKDQLKNLLTEARRVVAAMQPGPEKTQAEGVIAVAAGANPNTIRAVLDALKDMIEQARSKEASIDSTLAAREQAEAAREARIRELREQAYGLLDDLTEKGYVDEQKAKELQEQKTAIEAMEARKKELEEIRKTRALTEAEQKEYTQLQRALPQARIENADNMIEASHTAERNAIRDNHNQEGIEQARQLRDTAQRIKNDIHDDRIIEGASVFKAAEAPVASEVESTKDPMASAQAVSTVAVEKAKESKPETSIVFQGFGDVAVVAQNVPDVRGEPKAETKDAPATDAITTKNDNNTIVFSGFGDVAMPVAPGATPEGAKDDKQRNNPANTV